MNGLKIMPKNALSAWIERLMKRQFRVVGPVEKHGQYVFDEIHALDDLVIDAPITVLAPKKYLLPQREELFTFNAQTMEMKAKIEVIPTVILGIHACDMHAIRLLDKVNSVGHADQHYQARRAETYLVSFECLSPCSPQSFCKSMDTLSVPDNYDLHFIDLGADYAVQVGTTRAEKLVEGCINMWDATEADYQRVNDKMAEKWAQFDYRLNFDVTELPKLLGDNMQSPLWDELGDRCLACGACTQVCPTCYCFDVTDEVDLKLEQGVRVRTWDSCQIDKFAVVAGGHDFRNKRASRQRHRFMRKGKYQYEAFGFMGCVGCGRCALSCLVNITPIDTYNELYRRSQEQQAEAEAQAEVQA